MKHFREKTLRYVVVIALIMLPLLSLTLTAQEEPANAYDEYKVKAAYIYRFLFFIDWPQEVFTDSGEPIIIGIIGRDPHGNKLKIIAASETVYNRKLVIKRFKKSAPIADLRKCHLLYVSPVIFRSKIKKILDSLKNFPVLTVSEVKGFVHLGGMINFVIVEEEVKFEINKAAADYTGIKIHSSVLSLAIRVIGADHEK
jgi:hypothetical protein